MDRGLELTILWGDQDLYQVRVAGWNGEFGGCVETYVSLGSLADAAARLSTFPESPSDTRALQFGEFGRDSAGGAVCMTFCCRDRRGHLRAEVRFESDNRQDQVQSANLSIPTEPAAIDSFVEQLRQLELNGRGTAFLRSDNSVAEGRAH